MMVEGSKRGSRVRSALAPAFVAALAIVGAGCGGDNNGGRAAPGAFLSARPFVAVFDGSPLGAAGPEAADGSKNFHLAIHKGELGKPWFLSAYLKQLYPGAVAGGAAGTLGTRVVSFEAQNGKLFVFDVDRRKKTSDVFDPQVLIEAYPIVTEGAWVGLEGASDYVVFDPAAGLNRFDAAGDAFGASGRAFETELSFLQNFRALDDGVTFEQVFTGHTAEGALRSPGDIESNQFAYSGTMGVALRRYAEGEGFSSKPLASRAYYFESEPRLSPNTGVLEVSAARWNIGPGKPPVRWLLQSTATEYALSPPASDYDLVGAIKAGVESWNTAFGFEALRFEVGTPGDSFADDDKNVILFDPDPTNAYAFANWRTNPNTGEIRGASVYFNAIWVLLGHLTMGDDPGTAPTLPIFPALEAPRPAPFAWGPLRTSPLCVLTPAALEAEGPLVAALTPAPAEPLTKKQKVERYLAHVMAHEIGHTLGLRHNFKGSLQPPSSSIMDYLGDAASIAQPAPGAYDIDALRFLYDLSPNEPTQAFCTDEGLAGEALCARFDAGALPLTDTLVPAYVTFLDDFLAGASGTLPNTSLNRVLAYVRAGGSSETKLAAWDGAFGQLRGPLAPGREPGPVDAATRHVIFRLLLSPPELRGDVSANPSYDPLLTPRLVDDVRAALVNQNGALSFATRRLAVDALEIMQIDAAYVALVGARAELVALLPSLTGDEAALTGELIARIDRAVDPYFE